MIQRWPWCKHHEFHDRCEFVVDGVGLDSECGLLTAGWIVLGGQRHPLCQKHLNEKYHPPGVSLQEF
jgi:hypothetical protein